MTKPLDLHRLMGYHMKDNIHIFHLVPSKPVSDHWNCHRKVQEKVAWSCEHQKVDISPVLSYSTAVTYPVEVDKKTDGTFNIFKNEFASDLTFDHVHRMQMKPIGYQGQGCPD